MAYADDLLVLARLLANLQQANPGQACLRRAVSTSYYALFHLLISESTRNWAQPELRSQLGRVFEHGKMRNASERLCAALDKSLPTGQALVISAHLRTVAYTFIQSQLERENADYNPAKEWTLTEVEDQIEIVEKAFTSWNAIRSEPIAQAYLVTLLGERARSR
jgi:hypothetical protein